MRKPLTVKLNHKKVFPSFEHIDFTISTGKTHVRIILVYRPPPSAKNKLTPKAFLDDFTLLLEELAVYPSDFIIMGDFNIHIDNMSDSLSSHFCDILDSMGLRQHVTGPTHSAGHTLDLVITRANSLLVNEITVSDPGISDHCAITISLRIQKPPTITKQIHYCKIKAIDATKFIDDLNISSLVNQSSTTLEDLLGSYEKVLASTLDSHVPARTKTITVRPQCKWFDNSLLNETCAS